MPPRLRNHLFRSTARSGPFAALALVTAMGCGLHLHHPRDAATAETADGELKASRLVDGFVEELAQSRAMLAEEVAAAQAWAEVGRDRDLLDVLAARGESDPEVEALYFPRCQKRFRGDGWTTLCSKISTRLQALTGHTVPFEGAGSPAPVAGKPRPPTPGPDPATDLLRELRGLQQHWKGPNSGESRLARAVNEYELAARALRLSDAAAPAARCPLLDPPGRSPVLQGSIDLQRGLCRGRRDNLRAILERGVCRGEGCGPSELQAQAARALAVHDALAQHHEELARRLYAYEAAKHPCTRPDPPAKARPAAPNVSPGPGSPGQPDLPPSTGSPGQPGTPPGSGPGPAPSTPSPEPPPRPAGPASVAWLPVSFAMFPGTGLIGQPWHLLAAPAPQPSPRVPAGPSGATAGGSAAPVPAALALPTCDEAVLQHRFAALAEIPVPAALAADDLVPLGRLGRLHQLGEQLAALDALIESRQVRASRRAAAETDPAVAEAIAAAPRFARVLHATIVGIDRLQQTVDTFETAVLALIRETLRVERDALVEAVGHAERRVRLARVKLAAELDEAVLLLEAHLGLLKLERAGCTQQGVVAAHEAGKCRDEVAKALIAFGNAWTLGRAAEKRADVIDLGVRHDASIGRSRAAMALRQVYLAAGVAELVKFNKGGLPPEALAQIVVSAVGFGVVAAGVWAR